MSKIIEITPPDHLCAVGTCPSVFRKENGRLLIIGKIVSSESAEAVAHKLGDDELVIEVPEGLIKNIDWT